MAKNSIQPQYDNKDNMFYGNLMSNLYSQVAWYLHELPPYNPNSVKRDLALIGLAKSEPLLSGILASVVSRDVNRRWHLTGSARQVKSYAKKLLSVNSGLGWRDFISKMSLSYHNTNLGFAAEIGSNANSLPETLWSFDPTEVKLTGNPEKPLIFLANSKKIEIRNIDVIRANSLPSVLSKDKGLGLCAVERCLKTAQLALGIYDHDFEKLSAKPPKGLLLGTGIKRLEFDDAKKQALNAMTNADREVYSDLLSIFSSNDKAKISLIPFSSLPENWDYKEYIEIIVQIYALEFTYNASEFWAVASTNFNQFAKIESETRAATRKGDVSFTASLQAELSEKFLPSSLSFQFETRSEGQEQIKANLDSNMLDIITTMYESGLKQGAPLITLEQAQILLAENGFIKSEWVDGEDDTVSIEVREVRDSLLSKPQFITRALSREDEPIIKYTYNNNYDNGNVIVIAKSSHDFVKNRFY